MKIAISILAVTFLAAHSLSSTIYADWSTSSSDFGSWSVGTKPSAGNTSFTLMPEWQNNFTISELDGWKTSADLWPFVVRNPTSGTKADVGSSVFDPQSTTFHAGNNLAVTARFVADTSSTYSVSAIFSARHTLEWGQNKRITVSSNNGILDTFVLGTIGDSHKSSVDSIALNAGEWIDFSLEGIDTGHTPYYWGTSTKFDVDVSAVPEPTSLLCLLPGLAYFLLKKKAK